MLIIFNLIFIAFIGGIILFVKEYRKKKKKHDQEMETVNLLHKKELLKTQMEIQDQIMKYIGREIHDNIGQKLTLSSMYLQQLVFENKTQEITDNINNVNDIINESLQELRHISKSLTDDTVQNSSIAELISIECKKINGLKTHTVIFNNQLSTEISSYQTKSILLRITQEFFQNSIKHAKCDTIKIALSNSNKSLLLHIEDNGVGFDISKKKRNGIGLKNVQRRIELLNGEFDLQSNTNGTVFKIKIPI